MHPNIENFRYRSAIILVHAVVLFASLLPASGASPPADLPDQLDGSCTIEFSGSSTLHDFAGVAAETSFVLRRREGDALWEAEIDVPVARLTTDNRWRDSKMRAMFDSEHHPIIRASFANIDPTRARPVQETAAGVLPFTLQIRDVQRSVVGRVRHWQQTDQEASFDVEAVVSLRDFGLEAPTTMGFVRVQDEVTITAHVLVRKAAQEATR